MANQFAGGKRAIAECDRCGFQYLLKTLKVITLNESDTNLRVCKVCWEADHPQHHLNRYVVNDAEALEDARPDKSYEENRNIQWGWRPVGLNNPYELVGLTDDLEGTGAVGSVTVTTT